MTLGTPFQRKGELGNIKDRLLIVEGEKQQLQRQLKEVTHTGQPIGPVEIMSNFKQHKRSDDTWFNSMTVM